MMILKELFIISCFLTAVKCYYGNYHCRGSRSVIAHLFEWKWTDVATECEEFLAPRGYCAVQVSPASEHRVVIGDSGYKNYPWWQRYQPVSFKMGSRSGNQHEFIDMVKRCNDVGVRIYVDVLLNHMTGGGQGNGSDGTYFDGEAEDFPGVPFNRSHFHGSDVCHTKDLNIHNWNDPKEIRYCRLVALRDLRQSSDYVKDKLVGYLNKLIDWGVAGFRVDAAKHIFEDDLECIYKLMHDLPAIWFPPCTRPYIYQEVIDLGHDVIGPTPYVKLGRMTEFRYGYFLGDVIRKTNQRLAYLKNFGEGWGFIKDKEALVFVDNHDNQRGHGAGGMDRILTFFEPELYKMATAFELAWPYGHVRIMSSYYWPRQIQDGVDVNDWMGPPSDGQGNTKNVSCFGEWICEHRWRQIANMVRFRNVVQHAIVTKWWDNDFHAIAFARKDKGFIAINNEQFSIYQRFDTGLPDGEYCDVITCDNNRPPCGIAGGYCRDVIRVIDGHANIFIPHGVNPVVAIHV